MSHDDSSRWRRRRAYVMLGVLTILFLSAAGVSVLFLARTRTRARGEGDSIGRVPTQAISRTCSWTRFPDLCVSSLMDFPGAIHAGERDLVHISLNMTLHHVTRAFYGVSDLSAVSMDRLARSAYDACVELLHDSADQLQQSLAAPVGTDSQDDDVITWLSAALTNQDTCTDSLGVDGLRGQYVKEQMAGHLKDLAELVSNCLAIFAHQDFAGVPIQDRRLAMEVGSQLLPNWVSRKDRRLLLHARAWEIQPDIVVSKDGGNGTYRTITEAVKAVPEYSPFRTIIYVRAGRYDENVKVGRKKMNVMFVGDGKDKTVIAGSRSSADNLTTFHTATFAATGSGFIMKDMTIENTAGAGKHQAVALRVGADHSVVYRCKIIGYQDTLYVHSQRQFFRECDVYGTVDFIFGNAAVVLQNCSLWARKPLPAQKNTITAQNRKDPNQNTGISVHSCRILAAEDLAAANNNAYHPTYLGRPWKLYSRVVYMMSYMGDHVAARGWLEWNTTFALDTLYYGEYMNYGPGASLKNRVTWPGYRNITVVAEASKFTVGQFIYGSSWLPATGVAFVAGLAV